jgi:predicted protein tyrosine phosphatase
MAEGRLIGGRGKSVMESDNRSDEGHMWELGEQRSEAPDGDGLIISPARRTVCGISELAAHAEAGVTHVLSILDPDAAPPDCFASYPAHDRLDLRFHDIIAPEAGLVVPERSHVEALLAFGRAVGATRGAHLLVHCHMGVSRSTAAMVALLAQSHPEAAAEAVFEHVARIRPQAWPNSRMITHADALLDRQGCLLDSLAALYRRQLWANPMLGDLMRQVGRGAEVDMAL